jgi:hypothetical protein
MMVLSVVTMPRKSRLIVSVFLFTNGLPNTRFVDDLHRHYSRCITPSDSPSGALLISEEAQSPTISMRIHVKGVKTKEKEACFEKQASFDFVPMEPP